MSGAPIDLVLSHFSGVQQNGKGWKAECPLHEEYQPALQIKLSDKVGEEDRVYVDCHVGCESENVLEAVGLTWKDLRRDNADVWTPKGPAVAEYTYVDEADRHLFTVCRTADKLFPCWRPDSGSKTGKRWKLTETRRVLYHLPEVLRAIESGDTIYICEGEKDADALRAVGVTATCNPHGAGKWRSEYAATLQGASVVIVVDKDVPGRQHGASVLASVEPLAGSVRVVEAAVGKDAADHLAAAHGVDDFVTVELATTEVDAAVSLPPDAPATVPPEPLPLVAPSIAASPDILADFAMVMHARGIVGENRFAKVTYLCLTSRVLGRPISLAAKGPSSAGKSFVVQEVIEFFPESAVYALSSMSEHALAYSQEPLSHRFLVLYEAAGLESEFASYLLRSLLSEGCIRYETVEKVKGQGMVPRLIVREGPTGVIVTTTQVTLHPENETRLLSVPANDTPQQTAAIIRMLACEDGRSGDDALAEWRTLQTWIDAQDNRVTIPFAPDLAELVPPVAVRLRRDFATVLNLVKAHAILHQVSRARGDDGRIVATVADYGIVRDLIADLVADEVGATVPPAVVETVVAVVALKEKHEAGVTYLQLGKQLGLDKSAAMRRARVAMSRGYLKNLETRRGQPAKIVPDEPLPSEVVILPTVETLTGCAVARAQRGESAE